MRHRINTKFFISRNTPFFLFYVVGFIILGFNIILKNIGWFLIGLIAVTFIFLKINYLKNYKLNISNSYRWSIREALRTQYPQGIVYILENILQELNKFNIIKQPYKDHRSFENGSSDYYGFPNQSNLSAIIVKAKYSNPK